MARYLSWRVHRDVAETTAFLRRCEEVWADGSAFPCCLRLTETDELVGMLEIRVRPPKMDLGDGLVRRWWKQGLTTEALRHVVSWGLSQPEIHVQLQALDVQFSGAAAACNPR